MIDPFEGNSCHDGIVSACVAQVNQQFAASKNRRVVERESEALQEEAKEDDADGHDGGQRLKEWPLIGNVASESEVIKVVHSEAAAQRWKTQQQARFRPTHEGP